ncbi:MAG: hypothetical protein ACETVU_05650, partial [Desulfatiglandales bacterium]
LHEFTHVLDEAVVPHVFRVLTHNIPPSECFVGKFVAEFLSAFSLSHLAPHHRVLSWNVNQQMLERL